MGLIVSFAVNPLPISPISMQSREIKTSAPRHAIIQYVEIVNFLILILGKNNIDKTRHKIVSAVTAKVNILGPFLFLYSKK